MHESAVDLAEFLAGLSNEPGWLDVESVGVNTRATCGDTPLHFAIWSRNPEAARALIDAGADVNAAGEEGYTPLHVAIAQGDLDIVHCLLDHAASWDVVSAFGSSARDDARTSPHPEIRELAETQ